MRGEASHDKESQSRPAYWLLTEKVQKSAASFPRRLAAVAKTTAADPPIRRRSSPRAAARAVIGSYVSPFLIKRDSPSHNARSRSCSALGAWSLRLARAGNDVIMSAAALYPVPRLVEANYRRRWSASGGFHVLGGLSEGTLRRGGGRRGIRPY